MFSNPKSIDASFQLIFVLLRAARNDPSFPPHTRQLSNSIPQKQHAAPPFQGRDSRPHGNVPKQLPSLQSLRTIPVPPTRCRSQRDTYPHLHPPSTRREPFPKHTPANPTTIACRSSWNRCQPGSTPSTARPSPGSHELTAIARLQQWN